METRFFDSNGVKIAYTVGGSGDRTIIFVHGNGESGKIFKDIAARLSEDYRIICPDTRGHGGSGRVKRLSYTDMAEDIANLINHEGLDRPALFGFSDGGITGLLLAIKYPEILGRLAVAGINLTPGGLKPWLRRLQKLLFFFTRSDLLRLMLNEPNITADDLSSITVPTTVFYAQRDWVRLADSKTVIEKAKNSRLITVPNENHYSYVLNNEKLLSVLRESSFLQ